MNDQTNGAGSPLPEPGRPAGTGGDSPASRPGRPAPARPAATPGAASVPGPGPVPPPKRTSRQIREDIDAQRAELGQSVDQLRDRVTELTDWKGQLRKHRKQIIIGAVATGFVVGGLMALRRR